MTEHTSGKRHPRTWTEAEIEAIAAADTEFPPISEEDLVRALANSSPEPRRECSPVVPARRTER